MPTPCASDDGDGQDPQARADRGHGAYLEDLPNLLPTPQAHDEKGGKTPEQIATMRAKGYGVRNLNETAEQLLGTPRTSSGKGVGQYADSERGDRSRLEAQVDLLPTPLTTDGRSNASPGALRRNTIGLGAVEALLPDAVDDVEDVKQLLPTPNPFHLENSETPQEWIARRAEVQARTGTRHGPALPVVALSVQDGHALYQGGQGPMLWDPADDPDVPPPEPFAGVQWGPYRPAVVRHADTFGRMPPAPTAPGPNGKRRLAPVFVEWMMTLPEGHVTDPAIWQGMKPTAARNAQLKALGNGVVPPQAAAAIRHLLGRIAERLHSEAQRG